MAEAYPFPNSSSEDGPQPDETAPLGVPQGLNPEPEPPAPAEDATWVQPTVIAGRAEPGAPEPATLISPPGPPEFAAEAGGEPVVEPPEAAPPVEPAPSPPAAAPGVYPAPPPRAAPPAAPYTEPPLSPQDERTWAMLAHLSILLNLVTGFLGPVAAIIIYAVYRDRSRYVAYHAMQSFVFQLITWVGAGIVAAIAWIISGILAAILVGCLLMPIALVISLLPLGALVYGVVGAVQVNSGQDFRYWLVGDWVRGTLTG